MIKDFFTNMINTFKKCFSWLDCGKDETNPYLETYKLLCIRKDQLLEAKDKDIDRLNKIIRNQQEEIEKRNKRLRAVRQEINKKDKALKHRNDMRFFDLREIEEAVDQVNCDMVAIQELIRNKL